MSKEMRKYLDTFSEFMEKRKRLEVIVSYDCSDIHDPFSKKLHDFLKNDHKSEELTKSNYKIGSMLTIPEIDKLIENIKKLFAESTEISEAKREKRTVVKIITPSENQFIINEIINETK